MQEELPNNNRPTPTQSRETPRLEWVANLIRGVLRHRDRLPFRAHDARVERVVQLECEALQVEPRGANALLFLHRVPVPAQGHG